MKGLAAKRQGDLHYTSHRTVNVLDAHYFVYKDIKDAVKTNIRQLSTDERITATSQW